ncbi:SAV_2336 N-terminal domain-related protein [Streptomyces sp. NPDC087300]|uniref:SAV_2336 N-terminal domain-related protein n=1 Tax=Streptomyces sp. NPDC087300 TaxID=3365780 RepID=UPI0037F758E1
MTLDRLREALEALGPPVTPLELAEMLWLAERLPAPEASPGPASSSLADGDRSDFRQGTFHGPVVGKVIHGEAGAAGREGPGDELTGPAEGDDGPRPGPGDPRRRAALHVPHGILHPGTDADEVLVPAPQALRHELAIQRALRPLKRRVPDPRRRTLDEEATAARAARHPGLRPWAPVLVPATDRFLSLALVVDTGPAMAVWRPLGRELREAALRTGAFRDVRVWQLTDLGPRVGVRSSAVGPALDPAALVDPTGRQVVLVLSDCSGPHWWGGRADPALHRWAGCGPTAILQPLPERLWRRTAAPAVPGRAIASRAGAPNTALRFTPHDGRAGRAAPEAIPVPVLELAPEWLADWAGLVTASGDRHRDTAMTYVSAVRPPHEQPLATEGDLPITERILRFQAAASPTAADLAAHVALSVPALPVMRLIQQRVTPGSRPSDLAEVLLSGLLEPVDAERGLYEFVPGARGALLETLPRPESLAVADLLGRLGAEIEARAGSATRAFRAVVPVGEGAGSRGLGAVGQPFALVSEEALGVLRGRAIRVVERPVPVVQDLDTVGLELGDEDDWAPPVGLASPDAVTAPPGLSNIAATDAFVGRAHELDGLDRAFTDIGGVHQVVLHGAAGVGKTMLAQAWARRWGARERRPPVWWVKGDTPASLIRGIAELTDALQPPEAEGGQGRGRWEWALQWLSSHTGWALVIDGVEKPARARVLLSRLGSGGAVLITSRSATGWPDDVFRLGLEVPALSETVRMFKARVGREVEGATVLCDELGRNPGAVVRAAAHIAETGVPVTEYLARLGREEGGSGAEEAGPVEDPEPVKDPVPTDAIRDAIRETLRTLDDPMAMELLLVLAWLGADPVPRELLLTSLYPGRDVTRCLDALAESGLVHPDPVAATVTLPGRVGAVARVPVESLPGRGRADVDAARDRAVACLVSAFPKPADEPANWSRCRALLPLVESLCARTEPSEDTERIAGLFTGTAQFLLSQARYARAVEFLDRALACRRRLTGEQSPEAVAAMAELAKAHLAAGRTEESVQLFKDAQAALAGGEWSLSSIDALELRAGLADAFARSGDPDRGVWELEAVCETAARTLGSRHRSLLRLRSRLAGMYAKAGRHHDAVTSYEQALDDWRGGSGFDNLESVMAHRDLALACAAAGDTDRAVTELERVVETLAGVLGGGHPRTAATQADLAGLYRRRGQVARAVDTYEQALAASRSTLGAEHPQTLDVRERLAETHLAEKRAAKALGLFEEVRSVRSGLFGDEHPDTLRAADFVAAAYGAIGARERQIALYEKTLALRRELLGDGDLETLLSYERLAAVTDDEGRSLAAHRCAHADRSRALGEDHPETLLTLERFALARIRTLDEENVRNGLLQLQDVLTLRRDTQGPAHPDTLRVLDELADAFLRRGDIEQAVRAYEETCAHVRLDLPGAIAVLEQAHARLTSALGPTHPDVADLKARLARLR